MTDHLSVIEADDHLTRSPTHLSLQLRALRFSEFPGHPEQRHPFGRRRRPCQEKLVDSLRRGASTAPTSSSKSTTSHRSNLTCNRSTPQRRVAGVCSWSPRWPAAGTVSGTPAAKPSAPSSSPDRGWLPSWPDPQRPTARAAQQRWPATEQLQRRARAGTSSSAAGCHRVRPGRIVLAQVCGLPRATAVGGDPPPVR